MSAFIYAIDSNLFYSVSSFKIMIRAFSLHPEDYGNGLRLFWSFKTICMALSIFLLQRKCWKTLKSVILSHEWVLNTQYLTPRRHAEYDYDGASLLQKCCISLICEFSSNFHKIWSLNFSNGIFIIFTDWKYLIWLYLLKNLKVLS